ncbi:MAG TPA: methanogenesis marker 6 protein [Methanoregulaceae archaeon]|nr:methanogenesis marker 6 protein [Methanoregulaceae archaeon]
MSEAAAAGSAPAHAGVGPGTVAKYVFVDSPELTAADLALRAYEIAPAVQIKETCFGLVITGAEAEIDRLVAEIRKFDPDRIFIKDRGFPPGDERRCRANLGGARPGFYGHENEMRLVRYVSSGLRALRDPKKADLLRAKPKKDNEPLSPERLSEIIEES